MSRFLLGALAAALLFATFFPKSSVFAEPTGLPPQNTITMNFQNVDIPVLAKFISEITGRNFIIDESVRGKVTIISPTKVTPEQAYSIFQSVLQVKGFTTVQAGKIIKIEPARNVRSNAPLTSSENPSQAGGDEYVTRMVRLKNLDAASIVGVIQPMISHDGLVAAFPSDNTIIVTDDAYNVERLVKIISELDVRGEQATIVVIPLKLAFAGELAPEIDQLMQAKMGGGGGSPQVIRPQLGVATSTTGPSLGYKVIPDERTNTLIVLAPPLQMREIQEIVLKLDVVPPLATSRIHVYRLKNAQALEMVQVLNNLLNGGSGPTTLSPTTGKGSLAVQLHRRRQRVRQRRLRRNRRRWWIWRRRRACQQRELRRLQRRRRLRWIGRRRWIRRRRWRIAQPRFEQRRERRFVVRELGRQEHRFLLSSEYHG